MLVDNLLRMGKQTNNRPLSRRLLVCSASFGSVNDALVYAGCSFSLLPSFRSIRSPAQNLRVLIELVLGGCAYLFWF